MPDLVLDERSIFLQAARDHHGDGPVISSWTPLVESNRRLRGEVESLLQAHEASCDLLDAPDRALRRSTASSDLRDCRRGHRPVHAVAADRRGGHGRRLDGRADAPGAPQGRAEDHQAGNGQPPGDRPVRGGAASPGDDGPPEHRQGPRRRHDRGRPALLRHGTGRGRADHRVLRRPQPDPARAAGALPLRSATRCSTRTRRGSSTATSSRRTCWWPATTASRCPRSSTSAWPRRPGRS